MEKEEEFPPPAKEAMKTLSRLIWTPIEEWTRLSPFIFAFLSTMYVAFYTVTVFLLFFFGERIAHLSIENFHTCVFSVLLVDLFFFFTGSIFLQGRGRK